MRLTLAPMATILIGLAGAELNALTMKDFKNDQGMKPKATEFHTGDELSVMANAYLRPQLGQFELASSKHSQSAAVTYDSFNWCKKYPDRGLDHI